MKYQVFEIQSKMYVKTNNKIMGSSVEYDYQKC